MSLENTLLETNYFTDHPDPVNAKSLAYGKVYSYRAHCHNPPPLIVPVVMLYLAHRPAVKQATRRVVQGDDSLRHYFV